VWLERLGRLKKFNYLIGIRSRDLPACSIVLQPGTLPRAPPPVLKTMRPKIQQLFYCMCIRCRDNVFTEALPGNGRGKQAHRLIGGIYDVRR
jgi:hypothetical protein